MTQVITLVIAVICVFVLSYLAFKFYGISTQNKEFEQAKSSLGELSGKLMAVEVGNKGEFLYLAPLDWNLMSFTAQTSPINCRSDFCICLCPDDDCKRNVVCEKSGKRVNFAGEGKDLCSWKENGAVKFVLNTKDSLESVCIDKITSLKYEVKEDSIEVTL